MRPDGLVRFLSPVAVALVLAAPLPAQVIRGTVKAEGIGTIVPGARVTVTDTTNAVLAEAVSGSDGRFFVAFRSPSRFVVGVRKLGWKPSFSEPIAAGQGDTLLVDLTVPAELTEIAAAEIREREVTTFNARAIADATRKGWKVYAPEALERFRNTGGSFLDLMREVGVSGLVLGKGDCVRSVRNNRCLVYVIDGQPAGTNVFVPPSDVYFFAVLSATESATQWGDKAPWGAIVVYTRMNGDRRRP